MAKIVKRILLFLSAIVGTILLAVSLLVAATFFKPDWLINDTSFKHLPRLANHFGVQIQWGDAHIQAAKPKISTHTLTWDLNHLSVAIPSIPLSFSSQKFAGHLELQWTLEHPLSPVHLGNLGMWTLKGGNLSIGPMPSTSEPSTFDITQVRLPSMFDGATIQESILDFDNIQFITESGVLKAPMLFKISQIHRREKRLQISAEDKSSAKANVCWHSTASDQARCLQKFSAAMALRSGESDQFIRIASIGPIVMTATDLQIKSDNTATAASKKTSKQPETSQQTETNNWHHLFDRAEVADIRLNIIKSSVDIANDSGKWLASGDLHANISANSDTSWRGEINTKKFCANIPYFNGCFQDINLKAKYANQMDSGLGGLTIQKIVVLSNKATLISPASSPTATDLPQQKAAENTPGFDWRTIPFEDVTPRNYRVAIRNVTIATADTNQKLTKLAQGSLNLDLKKRPNNTSEWLAKLDARPNPKDKNLNQIKSIRADVSLVASQKPLMQPYQLLLNSNVATRSGETVNLTIAGHQKDQETIALNGRISTKNAKNTATTGVNLTALIDNKHTELGLAGKAFFNRKTFRTVLPNVTDAKVCNQAPPPGPNLDLTGVELKTCNLHINYEKGFDLAQLNVHCPVHFDAVMSSPESDAFQSSRLLAVDIETKFSGSGISDQRFRGRAWTGKIELDLLRHSFAMTDGWLDLQTKLQAEFLTSQDRPKEDLSWQTNGEFGAHIKLFSKVVELLKHLPYAVPAPLNKLDGTIHLAGKINGNSKLDQMVVPFTLNTDLKSPEQNFNTATSGEVKIDRLTGKSPNTNIVINSLLNQIAVTLPNFSIQEKFPLLFPDRRINVSTCSEQKKSPDNSLTFKITFNTPPDQPLRLKTNLVKDDVRISLEGFTIDSETMAGQIKIHEVGLEFFRRMADVKGINFVFRPDEKSPELNGDIEFKYTDITIHMLLHGTMDEPIITFQSDPIRTEREIVTILLYGEDAASDDEQLQTADDLSAAFADRMIGLASLFLLAQTPIESVRYNPATKTFNAKVRLDKSTSLNLGSTQEADQRIGVRHRLSSTWSVETDVSSDKRTGSASGSAFLEWSKRF